MLAERAKAPKTAPIHAAPAVPHAQGRPGTDGRCARPPSIRGKTEGRGRRARRPSSARAAGFRIRIDGDWIEARSPGGRPAKRTAPRRCCRGVDARLAELLGTCPYSSSMTVALGFDAADFATPPDRLRLPGPQEGAAPPGGLHLGRHQVPQSRARRQRSWRAASWAAWTTPGVLKESDDAVVCRRDRRTARDRRRHRAPPLHAHLPLAALDGAIHRGPPAAPGRNRSARGRDPRPATSQATPTTASASPTASAWAKRRRRRSWRGIAPAAAVSDYSSRRATMGSTRAAREAGTRIASAATASSMSETSASALGSAGCIP